MFNTTEAIKIAVQFSKDDKTSSELKKETFNKVFNVIKTKKGRGDKIATIIEGANAIKLESTKKEYSKLIGMAVNFISIQDRLDIDKVSYENIKVLSSLVTKIDKHFKSDYTKIPQLSSKGVSYSRYNNDVLIKTKEANKELALPKKEKVYEYEDVSTIVDKLTPTDKQALLDSLLAELYPQEQAA